jgi:hypothetical protein
LDFEEEGGEESKKEPTTRCAIADPTPKLNPSLTVWPNEGVGGIVLLICGGEDCFAGTIGLDFAEEELRGIFYSTQHL